jgi:hypothetical protein
MKEFVQVVNHTNEILRDLSLNETPVSNIYPCTTSEVSVEYNPTVPYMLSIGNRLTVPIDVRISKNLTVLHILAVHASGPIVYPSGVHCYEYRTLPRGRMKYREYQPTHDGTLTQVYYGIQNDLLLADKITVVDNIIMWLHTNIATRFRR